MTRFDTCVQATLAHEGGFADHPSDPGGATNWGISLRALRQLEGGSLGEWDLDGDGDVDADDMRLMTRDQAIDLYREHFWNPLLEQMHLAIAAKVFDIGVNAGPGQGARILQRALSLFDSEIRIDGVLGPMTLAAAQRFEGAHLLRDLSASQARFYYDLVAERRARELFLVGWLKRAYWVLA